MDARPLGAGARSSELRRVRVGPQVAVRSADLLVPGCQLVQRRLNMRGVGALRRVATRGDGGNCRVLRKLFRLPGLHAAVEPSVRVIDERRGEAAGHHCEQHGTWLRDRRIAQPVTASATAGHETGCAKRRSAIREGRLRFGLTSSAMSPHPANRNPPIAHSKQSFTSAELRDSPSESALSGESCRWG